MKQKNVPSTGIEPMTSPTVQGRSNRLSYEGHSSFTIKVTFICFINLVIYSTEHMTTTTRMKYYTLKFKSGFMTSCLLRRICFDVIQTCRNFIYCFWRLLYFQIMNWFLVIDETEKCSFNWDWTNDLPNSTKALLLTELWRTQLYQISK